MNELNAEQTRVLHEMVKCGAHNALQDRVLLSLAEKMMATDDEAEVLPLWRQAKVAQRIHQQILRVASARRAA